MGITFLALLSIAYIIEILRLAVNGKKKEEGKEEILEIESREAIKEAPKQTTDDKELVAVIAAAIASSLGVAIPQIRIKTIRRINTLSPAWSEAGRKEQITNRL